MKEVNILINFSVLLFENILSEVEFILFIHLSHKNYYKINLQFIT